MITLFRDAYIHIGEDIFFFFFFFWGGGGGGGVLLCGWYIFCMFNELLNAFVWGHRGIFWSNPNMQNTALWLTFAPPSPVTGRKTGVAKISTFYAWISTKSRLFIVWSGSYFLLANAQILFTLSTKSITEAHEAGVIYSMTANSPVKNTKYIVSIKVACPLQRFENFHISCFVFPRTDDRITIWRKITHQISLLASMRENAFNRLPYWSDSRVASKYFEMILESCHNISNPLLDSPETILKWLP